MEWALAHWHLISVLLGLLGSGALEARWNTLSRMGRGFVDFLRCRTHVASLESQFREQAKTIALIQQNLAIVQDQLAFAQKIIRDNPSLSAFVAGGSVVHPVSPNPLTPSTPSL